MTTPPTRNVLWPVVRYAAFFALFWAYVSAFAGPHIHYGAHCFFPIFSTSPRFLHRSLAYPGGPSEYVAAFLSQSYPIRWLGPLVLTGLALILTWGADVLIRALSAQQLRPLAFVPSILLLGALNQHFCHLTLLVPLVLATPAAAGYAVLPWRGEGPRTLAFLVIGSVVYYVAGGGFLLFAVIAALYEALSRRARLPALVALLAIEGIPYVTGTWILDLTLADTFLRGLPDGPDADPAGRPFLIGIYLSLVTVSLLGGLLKVARDRKASRSEAGNTRKKKTDGAVPTQARRWPGLMWAAGILVAAAAVVLTTYDADIRRALRIDYLARHGQWEAVLTEASRLPADYRSGVALQLVNRAFYELGEMPYEMFSFTQSPESLLVDMDRRPTVEEEDRFMRQRSQLWFQIGALDLRLGMINEAEHEAHETLAAWGEHPSVLRQLAYCNITKRQPAAAQVFLRALSHDLHYGREARDLLHRLQADPGLSGDAEVTHLRSIMLQEDESAAFRDIAIRCERLLERNPRNRMAFEYLMATHLLRKDLDQFAAELHRLEDFDYPDMPRHYEEAILIYEMDTSKRADRAGREISDETLQRYTDFTRVLAGAQRSGLRAQATEAPLVQGFEDTYFYYWFFGSPAP